MKKKSGFELRDVCGEKLIIPQGIQNLDFSKMINLNETAAFIWEQLPDEAQIDVDAVVEKLVEEYDVTSDAAKADVMNLLTQFKAEGIIED